MAGPRLSLVGAAEGAAPVVDASQILSGAAGDGKATFVDECAAEWTGG